MNNKNPNNSNNFNKDMSIMEKYIEIGQDGNLTFNIDKALANNEPSDIIEAGYILNDFSVSMQNNPEETREGAMGISPALSLPIWGNWCGPGYGGGPTQGVLDSYCKSHDLCYGARGYFACSCDAALIVNIRNNYSRMLRPNEKATAVAIAVFFANSWCNPFK